MIPFGDHALRFTIPRGISRRSLFESLSAVPNVRDVVLAEEIGCVFFHGPARPDDVERAVRRASHAGPDATTPRRHVIPVAYDGADLAEVAHAMGQTTEDVVKLHTSATYRVAMLGFLPGFAYLRGLPAELRLPRRAPRPRVPAGSVAIAADYTGIYPFASAGGWHLLGRAPTFEAFGPNGAAFSVDDEVRFTPLSALDGASASETAANLPPLAALHEDRPHLEITRAAGCSLLVDGGRHGHMHEGVAPGGPLVRSLMARANALVGNTSERCAVEIAGTLEVVARGGAVHIADDERSIRLGEGERHAVSTAGRSRVRYLSVHGGIDAPEVLGGRGALLVASIGAPLRRGDRLAPGSGSTSLEPAPLRRGDRLAPGGSTSLEPAPRTPDATTRDSPVVIVAGPDAPAGFSLEALLAAEHRVTSASDRTGTRLEATALFEVAPEDARTPSAPMVVGAIELTPSGLIVLGPDHPTTGGYPVVAVVRAASLDVFFSRPIGSGLRFVLG